VATDENPDDTLQGYPPPAAVIHRGSVRLREMVELANIALLATARDGTIRLGNAMAAVLAGVGPEEVHGRQLLDLFADRDRAAVARLLDRAAANERLELTEIELFSPGKNRWVDFIAAGSHIDAGEVLVALWDVTERREMRQEIARARTFFMNLIQSSIEAAIAADMKGTIILYNDGAERLLGYPRDEVIGKMHITRIYEPGKAQEVMRMLRDPQHSGSGKLEEIVVQAVLANGSKIPVRLRASIIYQEGKEVATVGHFHDMRERIMMEQQLRDLHLQLVQSEKMASLGKLAAGIAHQINNPLAGIMLFANLLMEKSSYDPDALEDLERIVENADRCREIVKDLLDFARQSRRSLGPFDLNRAIHRTLFLLANQPLFHNIEVVLQLEEGLPSIHADELQVNQVIMNLVLNAAQAMNGRGTLTFRSRPANDGVEFDLEDTGCGIAEENLSRIFEPFFTTKEQGEGTGLGLSVAYGIVSQHGGRIDVRSRVGVGTTFTVRLPAGPAAPEEGGA
jgi:PAS domain S-box-containing protein